jgi:hypothetical protein
MIGKKLIFMLENGESIPPILRQAGRDRVWRIDTKLVDPEKEYDYIDSSIEGFYKTNRDIMIIKFSGNKDIAKKIGDERQGMILHLIPTKENEDYTEEYQKFINIFYEETNIC